MKRFLILDIGAGTMDVLYYDRGAGLHYKAVVRSPVLTIAEKAARLQGNLLVTGVEMGGGPISRFLEKRAREAKVVMSASAAATIHHDVERVKALGIQVIDDMEAEALKETGRYRHILLGDLEIPRIRNIIEGFGVPFSFDAVGLCAQDHGIPPEGISHLEYRHRVFKAYLDRNPHPHALLFKKDEVPAAFNRLASLARTAASLPTEAVYVMDSGMAAILGASLDPRAKGSRKFMVMDVATSHTVGAALEEGKLAGFFEYHTRDISPRLMEELLRNLADGRIEHEKILREGGHGAYLRKAIGFQSAGTIIVTGPKRALLARLNLPTIPGAPLGDNMMTGAAGVLEAIRRYEKLEPLPEF
ncbi:MAG: pyruvate formate-lyase activating enzyme [Deltaproteobacteria bacterium]|nr:pyruvate formate-lyase activating enzyme [Deltaproteobacteria bacterium]MBW2016879.1 pyruvate formate-lyase activating enzyme [Deltaproteobacteria bacterium]